MYNKDVNRNQVGVVLIPILIIVLFIIGFFSYFAFQYYQSKTEQPSLKQTTPGTTKVPEKTLERRPVSLPDPTLAEEWNTYTNERWGFQFNYPGNITINKTTTNEDYGSMGENHSFMVTSEKLYDCAGKGCPKWLGIAMFGDLRFTKFEIYNDDSGGAEIFIPSFTATYEHQLNNSTLVYISGSYPDNNQSKRGEVLRTLDKIMSTFNIAKQ